MTADVLKEPKAGRVPVAMAREGFHVTWKGFRGSLSKMGEAQAAIFNGRGRPFEFQTFPLPTPGEGELLVEVLLATLCGSDLHTIEGRRNEPTPLVLGHEGVGRVVAVGPGRERELLGHRVTWTLADSCGGCRPCRQWDLPQKCESLFKYGHAPLTSGSGLNGCYATHLLLRRGTTVIRLPESITDGMAAPANCALATMCAVVEGMKRSGETAVIQGGGLLGLYGCALLRDRGWKRVIVVESRRERLPWIAEFGGEAVWVGDGPGIPSGGADAMLETAGDAAVVSEGMRMLRAGGEYVWVGMVHPESAVALTGEAVIRKCLTIRGVHNYAPRHLQQGVDFLERQAGTLPWNRLVSPPFPLRGLEAAVEEAKRGSWARVAIDPSSSKCDFRGS
jgi:putative phosphonate catabolism associated alcohol dehydrogenase